MTKVPDMTPLQSRAERAYHTTVAAKEIIDRAIDCNDQDQGVNLMHAALAVLESAVEHSDRLRDEMEAWDSEHFGPERIKEISGDQ